MVKRKIITSRASPSGIQLTPFDASIIKGMRLRGDRQHDIASWFGVNPGRIAEVLNGAAFPEVEAAMPHDLPPVGPYHSGRAAAAAVQALAEAKAALSVAEARIRQVCS
jgi:hypothetical protein